MRTLTDSDLAFLQRGKGGKLSLASEEWRRKLTSVSARLGVWGIIGGLCSIIVGPISPGFGLGLAGLGFLVGGIGAIGTSVLVAKDLRRAPLTLKLAALVGFPFGVSLIAFAVGVLWRWPTAIGFMTLAIPVGAILGVTLMILLVTGLLFHAFSMRDSQWEV